MQSIVAEGCPEDVALLEDILSDLTLDKDPSFGSIVLINDADEEVATDLNVISGQTQPDLARQPSVVPHEPICTTQSNANQEKVGATSCQEKDIEPNFSLTYEQVKSTTKMTIYSCCQLMTTDALSKKNASYIYSPNTGT